MPTEQIRRKRPQDKWNEANGYISKSYKLKQEVIDDFAIACEKANVSQAGKLTELMKSFYESMDI